MNWNEAYRLTGERVSTHGKTLCRIQALVDLRDVGPQRIVIKAGTVGGLIEAPGNLAPGAWVADNAAVWGGACVSGHALVEGGASVYGLFGQAPRVLGNARVGGDAEVAGLLTVAGRADVHGGEVTGLDARRSVMIFGNAKVTRSSVRVGDSHGADRDPIGIVIASEARVFNSEVVCAAGCGIIRILDRAVITDGVKVISASQPVTLNSAAYVDGSDLSDGGAVGEDYGLVTVSRDWRCLTILTENDGRRLIRWFLCDKRRDSGIMDKGNVVTGNDTQGLEAVLLGGFPILQWRKHENDEK